MKYCSYSTSEHLIDGIARSIIRVQGVIWPYPPSTAGLSEGDSPSGYAWLCMRDGALRSRDELNILDFLSGKQDEISQLERLLKDAWDNKKNSKGEEVTPGGIGFQSCIRLAFIENPDVREALSNPENIRIITYLAALKKVGIDPGVETAEIFSAGNDFTDLQTKLSLTGSDVKFNGEDQEKTAHSLYSYLFLNVPDLLHEMQIVGNEVAEGTGLGKQSLELSKIAAAKLFYHGLDVAFATISEELQVVEIAKDPHEKFLEEEYDPSKWGQYLDRFKKMGEVRSDLDPIMGFRGDASIEITTDTGKSTDAVMSRLFSSAFAHSYLDPKHLAPILSGKDGYHGPKFYPVLAFIANNQDDERMRQAGKYLFSRLKLLEYEAYKDTKIFKIRGAVAKEGGFDEYVKQHHVEKHQFVPGQANWAMVSMLEMPRLKYHLESFPQYQDPDQYDEHSSIKGRSCTIIFSGKEGMNVPVKLFNQDDQKNRIGIMLDPGRIETPHMDFWAHQSGLEVNEHEEREKLDSKFPGKKVVNRRRVRGGVTNHAKWDRESEKYYTKGAAETAAKAVWRKYFKDAYKLRDGKLYDTRNYGGEGKMSLNEAIVFQKEADNPVNGIFINVTNGILPLEEDLLKMWEILQQKPHLQLYVYDAGRQVDIIRICRDPRAFLVDLAAAKTPLKIQMTLNRHVSLQSFVGIERGVDALAAAEKPAQTIGDRMRQFVKQAQCQDFFAQFKGLDLQKQKNLFEYVWGAQRRLDGILEPRGDDLAPLGLAAYCEDLKAGFVTLGGSIPEQQIFNDEMRNSMLQIMSKQAGRQEFVADYRKALGDYDGTFFIDDAQYYAVKAEMLAFIAEGRMPQRALISDYVASIPDDPKLLIEALQYAWNTEVHDRFEFETLKGMCGVAKDSPVPVKIAFSNAVKEGLVSRIEKITPGFKQQYDNWMSIPGHYDDIAENVRRGLLAKVHDLEVPAASVGGGGAPAAKPKAPTTPALDPLAEAQEKMGVSFPQSNAPKEFFRLDSAQQEGLKQSVSIQITEEELLHAKKFLQLVAKTGGQRDSAGNFQADVYKAQGILPDGGGEITADHIQRLYARLIEKRPLMFMGVNDQVKLRNGHSFYGCPGDEDLYNYINYSEMELAAMLGVSADTFFINDGGRRNKGVHGDPGTFEETGRISAIVGSRMEIEDGMEALHLNPGRLGDEITANSIGRIRNVNPEFIAGYKELYYGSGGLYAGTADTSLNGQLCDERLMKRLEFSYRKLFADAVKDLSVGQGAYVRVVGLGDGVWSGGNGVQVGNAIGKVVRQIVDDMSEEDRAKIGAIEFSQFYDPDNTPLPEMHQQYFKACMGIDYNKRMVVGGGFEEDKLHNIKILSSKEKLNAPFSSKLPHGYESCRLSVDFAWDSGSYVGNEYWAGDLIGSGDPAAVCCSAIGVTMNPQLNPRFLGRVEVIAKDCKTYGLSQEVLKAVTVKDIAATSHGGAAVTDHDGSFDHFAGGAISRRGPTPEELQDLKRMEEMIKAGQRSRPLAGGVVRTGRRRTLPTPPAPTPPAHVTSPAASRLDAIPDVELLEIITGRRAAEVEGDEKYVLNLGSDRDVAQQYNQKVLVDRYNIGSNSKPGQPKYLNSYKGAEGLCAILTKTDVDKIRRHKDTTRLLEGMSQVR